MNLENVVAVEFRPGKNGEGTYLSLLVGPPPPMMVVHATSANPADPIVPVDWSRLSPPTQAETEAALARLEKKAVRPHRPVTIDTSHESFALRVRVRAWLDQRGLGARTARNFQFEELVSDLGFPPQEAVFKALDRIQRESRPQR